VYSRLIDLYRDNPSQARLMILMRKGCWDQVWGMGQQWLCYWRDRHYHWLYRWQFLINKSEVARYEVSNLRSGCSKCKTLTANVGSAAQALGITYEMEKVTDINAIIDAGVMRTPALAVDGKVIIEGKVVGEDKIQKLLA
jgi:small redox-active disulfide protein 2